MKLIKFKPLNNYIFILTFENGENIETDLKMLIEKHVSIKDLNTAQLNTEWGCLEFNHGMVDIDPKTLYQFSMTQHHKMAA
jgi:hypothetical protein